ncbi:MAG TPA: ABC transporter permease [Ilumatobacteraceae bacterium]
MPTDTTITSLGEPTDSRIDEALEGLDVLDLGGGRQRGLARRLWSAAWPKLAAVVIALGLWQLVVWSGWKPTYALAPPSEAFADLWEMIKDGTLAEATLLTMRRAAIGFALALVIGVAVGSVVARVKVVRAAVGSLITGLQTMPSIAWFPLAILMFQLSEEAILFVVVLGAAPAIANGLIAGADHIPPILLRAGRVLGAKGFSNYRHVVLPASLPSFVGGLKQGWAFAWRSLMAGELIVVMAGKPSLGFLLNVNRELAISSGLIAVMIVILVIGIAVDSLVFGTLDRAIRRRWGLVDPAS